MQFFRQRPAALAGLLGGMFGMVLLMALGSVIITGEGYGSVQTTPPVIYPNF